jgi:hypothetical protein
VATLPTDLHMVVVNGGRSAADARPGGPGVIGDAVAAAAPAQPTILTRAQWGADESLREHACPAGPDYSPTIKMGFLHHTDTPNGYSSADVPSIIRSIYAYHVLSNGWCDIGYNYLVDRFGRIWEGRYGGITRAVIGAHTGGFNYDSFGVSLIGNYESSAPSSAMQSAVERLFAWRLSSYYLNPTGTTRMTAASFSGSRYSAGTTVTLYEMSGHRDVDYTTCPGWDAYQLLARMRSAERALIGAGLVAPSASPTTVKMAAGPAVTVRAGVLENQTWTLTISTASGTTVWTKTGTASPSAPVNVAWPVVTTSGLPALPGSYTMTLTSQDAAGRTAVPYTRTVTVQPPVTVTGPAQQPYQSTVRLTGTAVPDAVVTVHRSDLVSGQAVPDQTVTASSSGAWSLTFSADSDYSWSASLDGYTTPTRSTRVGPALSSPTPVNGGLFVAKGQPLVLTGTALPGTTVSVTTQTGGVSGATTTAPIPVAADGSWSNSLTPTAATTVEIKDARGLAAPSYLAYPVDTPSASAPAKGYSAHLLTVAGNAGGAPVSVALDVQPAGSSVWTQVAATTAATSGAFSLALTLPTTSSGTTEGWRVRTAYGSVSGSVQVLPAPPPTVTAASHGYYREPLALAGSALPGDAVTVWTRPLSATTWSRAGAARAASTGRWSLAITLLGDVAWRVSSPSGTSAAGQTVIVPSLFAPASAANGATVTVSGRALPGQRVGVYMRRSGSTNWALAATTTAGGSYGIWSVRIRVWSSPSAQATSHGQWSRTILIRT